MDSQTLAIYIAGLVAPFITNLIKQDKITGPWAAWLALAVSVGCAVVALFVTGGLSNALADPTTFVKDVGVVMALATIVYHTLPQPTPTESTEEVAGPPSHPRS